jgi:hypothetical protein
METAETNAKEHLKESVYLASVETWLYGTGLNFNGNSHFNFNTIYEIVLFKFTTGDLESSSLPQSDCG